MPADDVSVAELPEQNVVGPSAAMVGVGNAFTVTTAEPDTLFEQTVALASFTETKVYT